MDLSIIKSEINKALSQSHAKDCTYDDLFNKTFEPQDPTYKSRVGFTNIQEFEAEVLDWIRLGSDFLIYIQHDDANFFGADVSNEALEEYEDQYEETGDESFNLNNLYHFTEGNQTVYIDID